MDRPNYYSILTAEVRYDSRLTADEKLLYSEITALTKSTGECWASNTYFSELYNVTAETISRRISKLKKLKYLDTKIIYKENSKEIDKRIITLRGIDNSVNRYCVETQGGIDNSVKGVLTQNAKRIIQESNNTSINKYISPLGDMDNVLLTEKEYEKLKTNYPNHYQDYIDRLSRYVASSGKKYKSHYATILNWIDRDKKKGEFKESVSSRTVSEVF